MVWSCSGPGRALVLLHRVSSFHSTLADRTFSLLHRETITEEESARLWVENRVYGTAEQRRESIEKMKV